MPSTADTIAAIATPLGEGGLSIVRISGPQAVAIADTLFTPIPRSSPPLTAAPSHTVHHGWIHASPTRIDQVLLSVLRAPRTFTGEDTIEISCHGGVLVTRMVLAAALQAGARTAEPGEFTRRAFLNGKIDLAQAEAVIDLIHARTELAAAAAREQLAGTLSRRIETLRESILHVLAHVEAHIDFPDEDIRPDTHLQLLSRLEQIIQSIDALIGTFDEGRILRNGVRAAILGRPNAGKSSLLNQLLGQNRAIVSPIPGTTRDTIEETANIRGIPVVFTDTAGLRHAADALEEEGIRRSHTAAVQADLILHVVDASEPAHPTDLDYLAQHPGKLRILVLNKADLPRTWSAAVPSNVPQVALSAIHGAGIDTLNDTLRDLVWGGHIQADQWQATVNARHHNALVRARTGIGECLNALRNHLTLELVAADLRVGLNAIGEIVGRTSTDDLLDSIFSQFCIGK